MAASTVELTSLVLQPKYIVESRGEVSDDASGSYGFVYEVKVKGVVRIAKKPHTYFLKKASEEERASVLASFKKECVLLSKLRHPNIVKFIGVYFGEGGGDDISMVMEKVHFELASFLRQSSNVQLATKLSILQDVSYGLVYLHEYNPPIIHRDLTARNILLTKAYQAKIADVGVAKLLDRTAMKAASHTKAPGQMFYMPPEACMEKAECTPKLDIFSFGHLSLHVLLEDYPEVFEVKITSKMLSDGTVQIMKRKSSLDHIRSSHCLYPLITQCLMDDPEKRPNTREVNSSIADFKETNSNDAGESQSEPTMEQHSRDLVSRLEKCVCEAEKKSARITNLLVEKRELDKKLEECDNTILALQQESNMTIHKNLDLEAKFAHLSSRNSDLVKTISDQAQKVKESNAHIELQSRTVAKLRDEHGMELSAEVAKYQALKMEFGSVVAKYQELEDERDRLKEDFQSARETVDQYRKELSSSRQQGLASFSDSQESCLLKEELASARIRISSLDKLMEQLQRERDTAIDESAIANIMAETFKADFEAERKDRERAQGLLDGYRNKSSTTKLYEKTIADLKKELHTVNQNWMYSKQNLSKAAIELKKCRHMEAELKNMKDLVKHLRKQIECETATNEGKESAASNKVHMGSGDSPPQRRSFFHKIFVGSSTLYQSIGFGNQESAEICDQDISPVEILSMALKDNGQSQSKSARKRSCESLEKCVHESEDNSVQVTNLLAEIRNLNERLEKRDQAILALQQESNVKIRMYKDLEEKCSRLSSKSRNSDLVKTILDQDQEVKKIQEHIEMQSRTYAKLRADNSAELSAELVKYHEIEDERDKLKEDIQSAKEFIDQLRKEISSTRKQDSASFPDIQETSKSQSEGTMEYHRCDMISSLEKCVHEFDETSFQVTNLLDEKRRLNKKLDERDTTILALQQEASVIISKILDLETKCANLSSRSSDLVKTISDRDEKIMEFKAHIKVQSTALAELRGHNDVALSAVIAEYQELEDERDRLREDFESAKETIDQLRKEVSSSFPDIKFNLHSCRM